jgi:peptidoglycan/LPS O-acetylase OafA/YrhL
MVTMFYFCSNWWPFFMLAFYLLAPFPIILSRRYSDDSGASNPCKEMAIFITAAIVVSAFGLPIVLARSPEVAPVVSQYLAKKPCNEH